MKLRTRLQGIAWGATGLTAGLAIWAGATGAYVDKPHQHNYQVPAAAEETITPDASPSLTPSVSPSSLRVSTHAPAPAKRIMMQPMDEPTTEDTTEPPVDPDPSQTDDGVHGPGGSATPAPPPPRPTIVPPPTHPPITPLEQEAE